MPPNEFVYDAQTSIFRLVSDGTVKDGTAVKDGALAREQVRALSLRTAKTPVRRELRKPDQFMYASRTSAFYLFGEEPGHARDSEDSESEERSAVMHRQVERRRQEASKTGESIGEALQNLDTVRLGEEIGVHVMGRSELEKYITTYTTEMA